MPCILSIPNLAPPILYENPESRIPKVLCFPIALKTLIFLYEHCIEKYEALEPVIHCYLIVLNRFV